jgi:hypothetical protein
VPVWPEAFSRTVADLGRRSQPRGVADCETASAPLSPIWPAVMARQTQSGEGGVGLAVHVGQALPTDPKELGHV